MFIIILTCATYPAHFILLDLITLKTNTGAWGSAVVKALRYKSVGPGIDSKWRLEFILWKPTFPCALGSTQPLKMSTRIFLGVKAAGA